MMKRIVTSSVSKLAPRFSAKVAIRPTSRSLSTLAEKEKGDEAAYFRKVENEKKAALKAKLDKILELEDGNSAKADILELLNKPVEEKGIVGKLGLDDWKVALPLGILAGVPLLHNEIIVLSAETQLLGVFILFCSTTYTQLGPSVAKSLDDYSNDVRQKLAKVDEAILSDVHETISATKDLLTLEEDVKSIHAVVDDLSVAQADVLNYAEEHKYRDAIARKLDSLVAIEEAATVAIRTRTVATVKADVIKAFTDDKKTKEAALDQAVAILLAGANAPIGKDIVGDVFKSSLKSFGSAYSKLSPEKDEILVQLQKDIDAVISPPQIDTTGSNVYISHPVKS